MASSSTQKPSSSSAPTPKCNFDVFLSFRGEDTRYSFTDHLFVSLERMGINTFRDNKLERGGEIAQELLRTIEGSRFSIIVFSERYADSKWCLDELTKIMECRKEMDQIVLPVFYHVNPSDVRKQKGSFGEAFANHEIHVDEEKVKRWRAAMTEAGSISGHEIKDHEYESKPIEEIINHILKRLNPKLLLIEKHIVGMDVHLEELKSLLKMQLDDVRMVGIYGIGGIGKTTIAKMVYNDILIQFNGASFLEGVKNRSQCHNDQLRLQQELLHGILKGEHSEVKSLNDGMNMIKGGLGSKKVLVVFDDVDDLDQVQRLVANYKWFGRGSRIIITTRDKHLLDQYEVDESYEAKVLCYEDAIELFSWHAFKVQNIHEDYVDMSNLLVNYAQGLPLALEVLGSSLHKKTLDEWKSALEKLKKNPNRKINDVLRISFDGLEDSQKEVFLDIACFFRGEAEDSILRILDNCAKCDIGVLHDRCLITVSYNMVQMHDLIQQMGWSIIREKHPSKRTRLWDPDDIHKTLSAQEGMEQVRAISYDLSQSKEIQVNKKVYENLKKLRFLKFYRGGYHGSMTKTLKVFLPKDFEFPSQELRYLYWEAYPLQTLPSNFNGENLVELHMRYSTIKQLWKGRKVLGKLKIINLAGSILLTKMPELSSMPNLEALDLTCCTRLKKFPEIRGNMGRLKILHLYYSGIQEIPSSIFLHLPALEDLGLFGCRNFDKFQDNFGNLRHRRFIQAKKADIQELPNSFGYLESPQNLCLDDCSNLENFPEIHVNMKRLNQLNLSGTAIKELPNAFGCLEALRSLDLSDCSNFEEFPENQNMGSLKKLYLNETAIKELPCSIGHLTKLYELNLENCKNLRSLPNSICGLKSLAILNLNGCSNLVAFPEIMEDMEHLCELLLSKTPITELPPSIEHLKGLELLELNNCEKLVTLPDSIGNLTHLTRLELKNCEKLVTLPNSIGNLTHLHSLCVRNCSKLHNLPDNLRSLQCCLEGLDLAGCNLMEGAIPSDLWCLSSLRFLDVSESPIPCIPTNIIQLSNLQTLRMNHCQMLEEIPELPSRLEVLEAQGCPHLGTLSTPSSPLWSSLLNLFKSSTQSCEYEIDSNSLWYFHVPKVILPGSGGIPEWISHQSMGCQAIIELPKNRYEDNNFLGFAVFFHHVPLDERPRLSTPGHFLQFELRISHDDQSERVIKIMSCLHFQTCCRSSSSSEGICYDNGSTSDPPLCVTYLPKFAIPSEHRYAKHRERTIVFEVEICGIHLIYSKNYHQQNQSHGPEAMRIHIRKDQDISCDFQASPYRFHQTKVLSIVHQENDQWGWRWWRPLKLRDLKQDALLQRILTAMPLATADC